MKWVGSRASSSRGSCSSTGLISSTRGRDAPFFFQALPHPRHQPAHVEELVHELRKGLAPIFVTLREVAHYPLLEIDLELVTLIDPLGSLWRLKDRVAHVDRVAKEDPRVGVGDDQRDARSADRHRRDLARGPAAEVGPCDQDIAHIDPGRQPVAAGHALHRVLAQLLFVQRVDGVLGRDDLVGVDVRAELPRPAADDLGKAHDLSAPTLPDCAGSGRERLLRTQIPAPTTLPSATMSSRNTTNAVANPTPEARALGRWLG